MLINLDTLLEKKGQFCQVTYSKEVKQLKDHDRNIVKIVSLNCRAGVEYDNMQNVQIKRLTGELPEENQGLPWGKWKKYPYIIEHKGKDYVRVALNKNSKPKTQYFLGGKEITRDEALEYALASEKKSGEMPDVLTIDVDKILSIT